jgi:hypothetical protein
VFLVGHRSHSAFSDSKISERKRGPFFLFLPDEPVAPKSPSSLSRTGHGELVLMSSDRRGAFPIGGAFPIEIPTQDTRRFFIKSCLGL